MKHIVQLNNNKMKNVRLQANQGLNNHHQKRLEDSFPRITQISLIGERNSGTSWIISHLRECFTESSGVRAIPKLVRFKHWFQEDLPPTDEEGERNNTVVIALFRDPYQWVKAMNKKAHHAPRHANLHWKEFVTRPWTMKRLDTDLHWLKGNQSLGVGPTQIECQDRFTFNQINTCVHHYIEGSNKTIRYELQNDGSPYDSVLDLRRDKILNHLSVSEWEWVKAFQTVRYEDLLANGTSFLLRYLERVTGVNATCTPFPAQPERPGYPTSRGYIKWMNEHVDWDVEGLIGYNAVGQNRTIPATDS